MKRRRSLKSQVLGLGAVMSLGFLAAGPAVGASRPAWSVQTSPSPKTGAGLGGVSCPSASVCIAVGASGLSTHEGRSTLRTLVERWDGHAWSALPTVSIRGGSLSGVSCTSPTACTAVGQGEGKALVERWDGRAWSIQPTPSTRGNAALYSVSCTSSKACMAVGSGNIDRYGGLLAERWDGRRWSMERITDPEYGNLFSVSCTSARACTAVGRGVSPQPLVERWNGSRWSVQKTPRLRKSFWLNGVSCTSASLCMAVGEAGVFPAPCGYGPPCGSRRKTHINTLAERWNGREWSIQPTRSPTSLSMLTGVSCPSARDCTAIGSTPHPFAEHWNGHRWSTQPFPTLNKHSALGGISCTSENACAAVGGRDQASARPEKTLTLIER